MKIIQRFAPSVYGSMAGALVLLALVACGGGGGGDSAGPAPPATTVAEPVVAPVVDPVKAAGISYSAFFDDRITPGVINFDTEGGVVLNSQVFTLKVSATGCTFNSTPADPTAPVCSPLASGEGVLFCAGTAGETFDTVLFKSTVVEGSIADLFGKTLTGLSCGSPSVRTVSPSITINPDGSFVEKSGGSTSTTGSGFLPQLTSDTGSRYFDFQHRFVVRKIVQGGKTAYFLMDIYENVAGTGGVRPPKIYGIEL